MSKPTKELKDNLKAVIEDKRITKEKLEYLKKLKKDIFLKVERNLQW